MIDAVKGMLYSVRRLFEACEDTALPSMASLAALVQTCAQQTTKTLHIAFAASDENLDLYVKLALLSSEKVCCHSHPHIIYFKHILLCLN